MNISEIKNQFPIFKKYPELVYLDSAATTQKPQVVLDRLINFYTTSNANVHRGLYSLSEKATAEYESSRSRIARFLGVNSEEIVFTSGTTAAANLVAYGTMAFVKETDILLTTVSEHHSNILPYLRAAEKSKMQVVLSAVAETGGFDYSDFEAKAFTAGKSLKLVVLTAVSNVLGFKLDIQRIVNIVRSVSPEAIIAIDLAQAVGHMPLDLRSLDIDFAYFSGHKLFASTGVGVLFGKSSWLTKLDPANIGGGMVSYVALEKTDYKDGPEKFEAGTPDIAGAISMAAAIDFIDQIGQENIAAYLQNLTKYTFKKLLEIPEVKIYGSTAEEQGDLISFNLADIHGHDVAQFLADNNIAVRAGNHCTQLLHRDIIQAPGSVRASWHIYNTESDIDRLVEALRECLKFFAKN